MKIGMIGGYGHNSVQHLSGVELLWAKDGYDDAVKQRAEGTVYETPEALFDEGRPDLIYIGSAYGRNGRLAVEALERGYDVICEKPLATDRATLARLRGLTASGERRVIAELTMRWSPAYVKARELICSGAVGKPTLVQAQKSYKFGAQRPGFYKTRALFGGIIPWVATHAIDFSSWCTGLRYEGVVAARHGNCRFPDYPEMEDHAALFLTLEGGVPCMITADFLRPSAAPSHSDDRLQVTGREGVVEVIGTDVTLTNSAGVQAWALPGTPAAAQRCAQELLAAVQGRPSVIGMEDSLHITEIALAARELADLN